MRLINPEDGGNWGIMGGVFDPVHYAHLILAEKARESFDLRGVLFVISFSPPHRDEPPAATFEDRVRMVELAVRGRASFVVSEIEKDLHGPGYTLGLVNRLAELYPSAKWHLILGLDNLVKFESWYQPELLARKVQIVVGNRPGYDQEVARSHWFDKILTFEMPCLDISSSEIRRLIRQKKSIRYLLPEAVRRFIAKKGLYQ
jgi:nicotinate-nucleotide adenylyltransferase